MCPFSARVIRCCNPFHLSCLFFPCFSLYQRLDFVRRISWEAKGRLGSLCPKATSLWQWDSIFNTSPVIWGMDTSNWSGRQSGSATEKEIRKKKNKSKRSRHLPIGILKTRNQDRANMSLHVWGGGWKVYNRMRAWTSWWRRRCQRRPLCSYDYIAAELMYERDAAPRWSQPWNWSEHRGLKSSYTRRNCPCVLFRTQMQSEGQENALEDEKRTWGY